MTRFIAVAVVSTFLPLAAGAEAQHAPARKDLTTPAAKISNAMSAAPASIAANATIMDWPAKEGEQPTKLREGTNDFTCFPHMPMWEGNAPMCLDRVWMQFLEAHVGRKPFKTDRIGIGYMIAPGGTSGSNNDPFASKATAENEWGFDPPHLMLIVPDEKALEGLPTTRQPGGPFVMFSGTPYVHIMIPVVDGKKK